MLTDDDVELLREVVDSALDRLSFEIAHTDNRAYRHNLKDRRDRPRGRVILLGNQAQPHSHAS
jgi:hypothetical protein